MPTDLILNARTYLVLVREVLAIRSLDTETDGRMSTAFGYAGTAMTILDEVLDMLEEEQK